MRMTMKSLLATLRGNITPMPFWAIHDHFCDERIGVEAILVVQNGFDLVETTVADYKAKCRGYWEELLQEMLIDGRVKSVVHSPTDMPIDHWDFYLGTYDIPGEQCCRALYVCSVYVIEVGGSP